MLIWQCLRVQHKPLERNYHFALETFLNVLRKPVSERDNETKCVPCSLYSISGRAFAGRVCLFLQIYSDDLVATSKFDHLKSLKCVRST